MTGKITRRQVDLVAEKVTERMTGRGRSRVTFLSLYPRSILFERAAKPFSMANKQDEMVLRKQSAAITVNFDISNA